MRDVMTLTFFGGLCYAWLCAIVAPLAGSVRSLIRLGLRRSTVTAVALAAGGAVLWSGIAAGGTLLGMMLEPRAGLFLLRSHDVLAGVAIGAGTWVTWFAARRRLPRIGSMFETATALAIVALARDDPGTLARAEALYRGLAIDGSTSVSLAPPSGRFDASTSPPWRRTIARTIDRPRPLPDGTRVPAREASAL